MIQGKFKQPVRHTHNNITELNKDNDKTYQTREVTMYPYLKFKMQIQQKPTQN